MENYEENVTQEIAEVPIQEIPQMEATAPQYMSKKEYIKNHAPESFYKAIRSDSIAGYVLVGINVVLMLFSISGGVIDMILTLAFVLGVHLKKSKGCAIALTVYGVVNCIFVTISTGRIGGWFWLVLAIGYLKAFSDAEKEYKKIYG